VFAIQSEIRRLRKELSAMKHEIYLALIAGAQVEDGPHSARIVVIPTRRGRIEKLVVR
jgi:hypothetical protein